MEMYLGKSRSYSTIVLQNLNSINFLQCLLLIHSFQMKKKMISPQCVNRILHPAMPISKINITTRVLKIKKNTDLFLTPQVIPLWGRKFHCIILNDG